MRGKETGQITDYLAKQLPITWRIFHLFGDDFVEENKG
jgi:hypothetical protein